jgi:hypothetical protein
MNVGFTDEKNFIIKKEKMKIIDNASLLEPYHELRLKEVLYNANFILVPRFVFYPFSKWYKCTKTIERKVITYKQSKNKSLNLFKKRSTSVVGNAS